MFIQNDVHHQAHFWFIINVLSRPIYIIPGVRNNFLVTIPGPLWRVKEYQPSAHRILEFSLRRYSSTIIYIRTHFVHIHTAAVLVPLGGGIFATQPTIILGLYRQQRLLRALPHTHWFIPYHRYMPSEFTGTYGGQPALLNRHTVKGALL